MNLKKRLIPVIRKAAGLLLATGLLTTLSATAASPKPQATKTETTPATLHQQLAQKDAEFFERGFNQCDLAYLEATISPELKFYHDQSGFQDKTLFMENTRRYLCSDPAHKPIRKLTSGSLSTFPLYRDGKMYGAIQHGKHQFYLREPGKPDQLTGTARFTSVWLKQNNDWQLADVLSYDHQSAPATPKPDQASTINALLKEHQVPALGLGLIKNGVLDSVKVYGELTAGQAAPKNTIFKVASLTKPVVALLTLRLVDAGELQLDEPLAKYWVDPDLIADPRHLQLTPRLVLTHQTGFANWRYLEQDNKLRFQFEPGKQHQYSGEGFEYLRQALERKFGQPLEALAQRYVFEPAGMTDTHFFWTADVDEKRYAQNHDSSGKLIPLQKYYTANAAANLLSTTEDYSKFLLFVLTQQQSMPELYQQMLAHQVNIQPNSYFGLGWQIFSDFPGGESALLHTGKDPGVSTAAVFFPQSRNGYVILMNGDNTTPILEQLLPQLYLGAELWQRK